MTGPTIYGHTISCRGCEHIAWYHCGHPDAPQGTVEVEEWNGERRALSMLPLGDPIPTPPWCPYPERVAYLENMLTLDMAGQIIDWKQWVMP